MLYPGEASRIRSEALNLKTEHDIDMDNRRFKHDQERHDSTQRILEIEATQRQTRATAEAESALEQAKATQQP